MPKFNNILSIEEARARAHHGADIFIFDRDSTLLDEHLQLVYPNTTLPLLNHIAKTAVYGIASRGGYGDDIWADPLISQTASDPHSIPFCPELYAKTASSNIESLFSEEHRRILNRLRTNNSPTNNDFPLTCRIGKIIIKLDATAFEKNGFFGGKNTAIFELLDILQCKFPVESMIGHMGIQSIEFPPHYHEIMPQKVIMVDDERIVCRQAARLGFTAITANSDDKLKSNRKTLRFAKSDSDPSATIDKIIEDALNEQQKQTINELPTHSEQIHALESMLPQKASNSYLIQLAHRAKANIAIDTELLVNYMSGVEQHIKNHNYRQALLDIQMYIKTASWEVNYFGGITVCDPQGNEKTYSDGAYHMLTQIKKALDSGDETKYSRALDTVFATANTKETQPSRFYHKLFKPARAPETQAFYEQMKKLSNTYSNQVPESTIYPI